MTLAGGPVGGGHDGENALVGVMLCKTVVEEPRKKASLPSSACLSHTVARLLNAKHTGTAVGTQIGNGLTVLLNMAYKLRVTEKSEL